MKKLIILVTILLITNVATLTYIIKENTLKNKYDVNDDGKVSVTDAVVIINYIKNGEE